ncbi:hypothetical protein [Sediminicurvatus halobius]|uniref:Uncharacterized protein n=1 Tax=Sediminicurvatus halobius TaxID=2182432 RepID=A0A2U2N9T9_9GAMM|nr:hypothetical protein [Spiribacter halobius]PWG65850.1 hypothetical protein DEM34_00885 [Spiribacter halobius]UEX77897.1 hypothetical protein LMH63_18525 [Spiribacter halobius]
MRGQVDRRARRIHQRVDGLVSQLRTFARSPVALPVAFVAGILAQRLPVPVVNRACRLLTGLAGPAQALRSVAGLAASAAR